uniref:4-(cytidine 5'-diphospho)-2-C-methyl-D-erythritol kinase n=1 Tax=Cephaloticoccus sp. TaxID=1985742 RepID=UPI00404A784D
MSNFSLFSPAKINLYLAITGRRADGYHDLVSVVAPLNWGDTLHVTTASDTVLTCDDPTLAIDETNLILKATAAFRADTGWKDGVHFRLDKRIPVGAGLGGGSSNAVAALRALNQLAGYPLDHDGLRHIAAGLGADCVLFLEDTPVMMRGRGEIIERLSTAEHARFMGRRLLLFKPGFGVSTAWAYAQMARDPANYLSSNLAEAHWQSWREAPAVQLGELCQNNMEQVVFTKYPALPALYSGLTEQFGLQPHMSGSGSASFIILEEGTDPAQVASYIREAWGPHAFVLSVALA